MKALFKKHDGGLYPLDDEGYDLLAKVKYNQPVSVEVKKMRNVRFHRKFFSLLNYAFQCWEPNEYYKGQLIEKDREAFRSDIIIMAGYREAVCSLSRNEVRWKAKSISFAKMTEEEFEKLYSNTIDVILKHVLTNYTKEDLEEVVANILSFC